MIISNGAALDFAPQALGEIVPNVANGYFYGADGLGLLGRYATYAALYRTQPSIATLVDKVSNSAARLTLKVWDPTPKTGKVQDTTSAYAKLIANPSTELSTYAFYRWTFATYEVYGEAFWYKQRNSFGQVANLLPMHPTRTAIHRTDTGEIEYIFTLGVASAGLLRAPERDVVPFLRYNPETLMRGLSRLEPLRSTLKNEDAARRANESWWKRGARPSVVLSHPGELSQDAMDRIKQSFDARHAGADNMGGSAVLQEGMTATVVQLNAEQMQYIESRKLNMQEACMVFDVPPPVVHILDRATFSNITEQMRSMYRDTMSPRLEDFESVVDYALRPEFFSVGEREASFDMDEVLRGDYEARVASAQTIRQSGIGTGNEARALLGMPLSDDPEMDKLYANSAVQPLAGIPTAAVERTPDELNKLVAAAGTLIRSGFAPEAALTAVGLDPVEHLGLLPVTLQADTEPPVEPTAPATDKSLMRKVLSQIGRVKASKKDIRETLTREHEKSLADMFDRQRAAALDALETKVAGVFDPAEWDGDLSTILHTLSLATAQAIGEKVASDLGGKYSSDEITDWLTADSESTAKSINQTTADQIAAALDVEHTADALAGVFDGEIAARGAQIASTRVAVIGGLASQVAARLSKAKTKTWVTGTNARPEHAAMSGETVPLGSLFSNGMNGPGDYRGGIDEVAGCNCDLTFNIDTNPGDDQAAQDYYAGKEG